MPSTVYITPVSTNLGMDPRPLELSICHLLSPSPKLWWAFTQGPDNFDHLPGHSSPQSTRTRIVIRGKCKKAEMAARVLSR